MILRLDLFRAGPGADLLRFMQQLPFFGDFEKGLSRVADEQRHRLRGHRPDRGAV